MGLPNQSFGFGKLKADLSTQQVQKLKLKPQTKIIGELPSHKIRIFH